MAAKFGRSIIRLSVEGGDLQKLEAFCASHGMTQISALSRMVKWFARQDHDIQSDILIPDSGDSLKRTVKLLRRIAAV
jgi:hypothetical protein